ncbi:putative ABC transport system ATP-binding protein/ATP-binding cassette subfamily B protein [Tumebacillus sp. BK434]|uniref:ABC transporter ATP-binding protein n=1 Tax=Tumebacillus sp. BK434 TaxID=2512169 RepID=UPI0010493F1D|nr:ABC transporter ATP-binding protein [Tumebacillus sp. BK434]TCP58992.1 putative ABC transport system ATP-binding protein/ATP-binding cassette subfamily B protein [Tumebacillus sp. BK434]
MGIAYLLRSFRFVWQHGKGWVILTAVLHVLSGLFPLASLWVVKELVNAVSDVLQGTGNYQMITVLLLVQFGISVLESLFRHLQTWMDKRMEVRLEHDLQKLLAEKLAAVPVAYFDLPRFYQHLDRIQGGVGRRFIAPILAVFDILQRSITLISMLAFLFMIHWSFLVISLVAAVPILIMQARFGQQRFFLMLYQTPAAREAGYMSHLMMDRQGAKEVRLFNLAGYLIGRWSNTYRKNAREALHLMRKQQGIDVLLEALSAFFYMASAGILVWLMKSRPLQIGDFVSIGQAVHGAQGSLNMLAMSLAGLYEEMLYIRDFFTFLEFEEPELRRSQQQTARQFPERLTQGITVEHVSFQYPDTERRSLSDVSFHIAPGERVAIVGENGSGKTTLVKLLMGLYPIREGRVLFDGIPVEELDEQDVYRNVTVIFQDFMKYALTVRENIALGDIERIDDLLRLEAVARETGVDRFVQGFEEGYETNLGRYLFDGEDVSGGQWQKIALARALFRGGQIMILDEPTAALDPQAEMDVFRQFGRLTENKTAVFISHRMAAARMADRILVMKDGSLAEIGTHEELIAQDGEYSRMYRMQAQWYTEEKQQLQEAAAWKS